MPGAPSWLTVGATVAYTAGSGDVSTVSIKAIHTDDPPELYCTILLAGGDERQTPLHRLRPCGNGAPVDATAAGDGAPVAAAAAADDGDGAPVGVAAATAAVTTACADVVMIDIGALRAPPVKEQALALLAIEFPTVSDEELLVI